MFGRRPDRAAYQSKAVHVSLPDATFGVPPERVSANAPRGPRVLDPDQVISASPIGLEIPPGEPGLAQLEAAGAIRRPRPEEVDEFVAGASRPYQSKLSPDHRLPAKFDYVITREVVLPRLQGLQEKRFLALAGVPVPRGVTGRACIAQIDGFRVNDVASCFGDAGEGIERLRHLPAVEKAADCRLMELSKEASLEAVAVYEPENANRAFGKKPTPHPIDVRVEKAGDVALVLNTYEPATWRVSSSAGTRVVGVVLIGYYTSTVEGIGPDTPVINADHEGRGSRPKPTPACAALQSWIGSAYRGGADALVLDRQVLALTGRNLDSLRGAYRLKHVALR
jgi:hypothetical protein